MAANAQVRPRVISVARISSDTEKDEHGVKSQHKRNHDNAEALGWDVVAELEDNDKSASNPDVYREGFERLIRALALGHLDGVEIDGLILVEQSRLARNHTQWEQFSNALTSAPGRVYAEGRSVHDPYSDAFELHGTFGTYTNKAEVKKIKMRTKASHHDRASNGIPVGGSRPFGWNDDRRTLHPVEAEIAREIVAEFLNGRTIYGIAMWLQERGVTTTKGNPWSTDALRKYLANPRLCGWRMLNGSIVRDENGDPVVGQWEPIISVEDWQAIEHTLNSRKRAAGVNARKHLLSGFLRCGKCGGLLKASPSKFVSGGLLYVCRSKAGGGCSGVGRNGRLVEAFVVEAVLSRAEKVAAERAEEEGPWSGEDDYREATTSRTALTQRWAAGGMGDESYFEALEAVEGRIRALKADKDAWEARTAAAERVAGSVREEWEKRDDHLDWRRAFLADHLKTVMVLPVGGGRRKFDPESLRLIWNEH